MIKGNMFYSIKDVASMLKVHPRTILRAIHAGRIKAFKIGSGKRSMFRISEVEMQRMQDFDLKDFWDNHKG